MDPLTIVGDCDSLTDHCFPGHLSGRYEASSCATAARRRVGHHGEVAVFDDIERSDGSEATHAESHAQFLNRVHTPYWASVRELIESWFSHLPKDAHADVRARLRSRDDRQFHAAFWELYLHETLIRSGCRVVCHPEVSGTSRRPDFLVEGPDGEFYLEARVASEADDKITADRRRNRVYDSLDRLDSPNFFLWVDVEGEGASDLAARGLRRRLHEWLAALDPDEVHRRLVETEDIRSITPFEWRVDDWCLVFRPWPKAPESRGNDEIRPLGVFGPGAAYMVDDVTPLKKALSDKGSAYGDLDRPYIVAVRTSRVSTDEFDILNALFGSLQVQFSRGPNGETATRDVRAPDGYWFAGTHWQHRNVSGVLIARGLQPWTVSMDVPTLWEHPEPERPVAALPMWRRSTVLAGALEYVDAVVAPHELLGLPEAWPEGDAFDPYPADGASGTASSGDTGSKGVV